MDTHTATIDWGDGSALDTGPTIDADRGGGTITGTHSYAGTDRTVTVEVCVEDQLGARACDTRELDLRLDVAAPEGEFIEDSEASLEAATTAVGFGWTDANVDDTFTVSINWGDGSAPENVPVTDTAVGCVDRNGTEFDDPSDLAGIDPSCQQSAVVIAEHAFPDDGPYTVTATIVDSGGETLELSGEAQVDNVAPLIDLDALAIDGVEVTVTGSYTDASAVDTHRIDIAWGDGTSTEGAVTGGMIDASHTYARAGDYDIEVCITDDDGGRTCADATSTLDIPFIVPLTPARLLDTRPTDQFGDTIDDRFLATGKQPAGTHIELDVLNRGGIASNNVDAVVINLTATGTEGPGFATAYPCGTRPNASSVNYTGGDVANEIIVKLSPTDTVCIYTETTTHLIADVVGYIET